MEVRSVCCGISWKHQRSHNHRANAIVREKKICAFASLLNSSLQFKLSKFKSLKSIRYMMLVSNHLWLNILVPSPCIKGVGKHFKPQSICNWYRGGHQTQLSWIHYATRLSGAISQFLLSSGKTVVHTYIMNMRTALVHLVTATRIQDEQY